MAIQPFNQMAEQSFGPLGHLAEHSLRPFSSGRSTTAIGCNIDRIERNIESIEAKITKIFKWPKNREDGSDFDDFRTESIGSTRSIFSKIFEWTKNYRIDRINRFNRSIDRSIGSIEGRHDNLASSADWRWCCGRCCGRRRRENC